MARRPRERAAGPAGHLPPTVLTIASTHGAIEALTDRLSRAVRRLPLAPQARFELRMAVHEALTNAAEHGNQGDPAKKITVTCLRDTDRVVITVEDEGNGFDPAIIPDCTTEENLLRESGRGICLIRALSDECCFEKQGRRVVITKRFSSPARTP